MSVADESNEGVAYLFGAPIRHSLSPLMHNTIYKRLQLPWRYELHESVDMKAFLKLLREPRCVGASITMPHKLAIMSELDIMTEEACEVGACNTVMIRRGSDGGREYVGTNTDVVGIRGAFFKHVADPPATLYGRPGLVIGSGGAARSAIYALKKWMQCPKIYVVNRDAQEFEEMKMICERMGSAGDVVHVRTVTQAERLEGPGAVVGCIPDIKPRSVAEVEARRVAEFMLTRKGAHRGAMLEMAYHPTVWTGLADVAHGAGWQVILGTEAMICQGIEQARLWTGRSVDQLPLDAVEQAVAAELTRLDPNLPV